MDLENCKIFVNQGKGRRTATSCSARASPPPCVPTSPPIPHNRWLFQTRRCGKFSTRRVQQVVKLYAEQAGVNATPHTFRHQAITWLTKHSGLADAELQLITGHARRETLAIYQHVAVDGQLADKYQAGDEGGGAVKDGSPGKPWRRWRGQAVSDRTYLVENG